MGKQYSVEEKVRAKEMFLNGRTLQQIANELAEITGRPTAKSLIWRWATKDKWGEERMTIEQGAIKRISEEVAVKRENEMLAQAIEQMEAYRELRRKGIAELSNQEARNTSEATTMIDVGIKGEQRVAAGVLPIAFV